MFSGAALRRHCQPMFGCGVEVGERAGTQQPVEVLGQAAITDFGEAELSLMTAKTCSTRDRVLLLMRFYSRTSGYSCSLVRQRRLMRSAALGARCRMTSAWP